MPPIAPPPHCAIALHHPMEHSPDAQHDRRPSRRFRVHDPRARRAAGACLWRPRHLGEGRPGRYGRGGESRCHEGQDHSSQRPRRQDSCAASIRARACAAPRASPSRPMEAWLGSRATATAGTVTLTIDRGGKTSTVATVKGIAQVPRFSPDGKRIALLVTVGAAKESGAAQAGRAASRRDRREERRAAPRGVRRGAACRSRPTR